MRLRQAAARPRAAGGREDQDLLRALSPQRPRKAGALDRALHRGRAGLPHCGRPGRARRALAVRVRPSRSPARRPSRDRAERRARMQGVRALDGRLRRARRTLRCSDRPGARPLLDVSGGAGSRGRPARGRRRQGRSLRGFVRLVRGAGIRAPLPRAAALAHAGRDVSATGHGPGGGRPRRGGAARPRVDLRAEPRLPRGGTRRPGRPRHSATSRRSAPIRSPASARTATALAPASG